MKRFIWYLSSIAILLTGTAWNVAAVPIGQNFTYQGQLTQNGSPVNGPVTLQFSLWDAATGGNLVPFFGHQVVDVTATNGAFTATLSGNLAFFTGEARWLEIAVCSDPACNAVTTLSPRQPLTAVPYAMYAMKPWARFNNDVYLDAGMKVGIGGPPPLTPLDIYGEGGSNFQVNNAGDLHVNGGSDSIFGLFNDGDTNGGIGFLYHGFFNMYVANNGQVGVGTVSPAPGARLDVRGSVRLGSSGELYAPGSPENLRIVRGVVNFDGSAPAGCCFTVSHAVTGQYDITFAESFSSPPSLVASSTTAGGLVNVVPLSNQSVRVVIRNSTNTVAINGGFHFIATGER